MPVFYVCDRKACGEKHDCRGCRYTIDVEHAVNFEKLKGGNCAEKEMYKEKAERINELLYSGKMTINEARKEYGLMPILEGDERFLAEDCAAIGGEEIVSTINFYADNEIYCRVLQISLPLHDWYKLQKKPFYRKLMRYLDNLQTQKNSEHQRAE